MSLINYIFFFYELIRHIINYSYYILYNKSADGIQKENLSYLIENFQHINYKDM